MQTEHNPFCFREGNKIYTIDSHKYKDRAGHEYTKHYAIFVNSHGVIQEQTLRIEWHDQ